MQAAARVDTETWTCEAALTVALDAPKILMLKLVEQIAADTVLRATPGLSYSSLSLFHCMHALFAGVDAWLGFRQRPCACALLQSQLSVLDMRNICTVIHGGFLSSVKQCLQSLPHLGLSADCSASARSAECPLFPVLSRVSHCCNFASL